MLNCNIFIQNLDGDVLYRIPVQYNESTLMPILDTETKEKITNKIKSLGLSIEDTIKDTYPKELKDNVEVQSISSSEKIFKDYKKVLYSILGISDDVLRQNLVNDKLAKINFFKIKLKDNSILTMNLKNYDSLIQNDNTANLIIKEGIKINNDFQEDIISTFLDAVTQNGTASEKIEILKLLSNPLININAFSNYFYLVELNQDLYIKDLLNISKKYHNILKNNNFKMTLYYSEKLNYTKDLSTGDIVITKDGKEGFFIDKYKNLNIMFSLKNKNEVELMVCDDINIDKVKYQMISFDIDLKKQKFKPDELKNEFNEYKDKYKDIIKIYEDNNSYFVNCLLKDNKNNFYKIIDIVNDKNNDTLYILEDQDSHIKKITYDDLIESKMDLAFNADEISKDLTIPYVANPNTYIEYYIPLDFGYSSLADAELYELYKELKEGDEVKIKKDPKSIYKVIKKNKKNIKIINIDTNTVYTLGLNELSYIKSYKSNVSDKTLNILANPIQLPDKRVIGKTRYAYSKYITLLNYKPTNNRLYNYLINQDNEYVYDTLNYRQLPNNDLKFVQINDLIGIKELDRNKKYKIKFYKILNINKDGDFFVKSLNIDPDNSDYKQCTYNVLKKSNLKKYNLYSKDHYNFPKFILQSNKKTGNKNFDNFVNFVSRKFGMPVKIVTENSNIFAYTDGKAIYLNITGKKSFDLSNHGTHELLHIILGFLRYNDPETYYKLFSSKELSNKRTFEDREEDIVKKCVNILQGDINFENSDEDNYNLIIRALCNILNIGDSDFLLDNIEKLLERTEEEGFNFGVYSNEIASSIPMLNIMDNIEYTC